MEGLFNGIANMMRKHIFEPQKICQNISVSHPHLHIRINISRLVFPIFHILMNLNLNKLDSILDLAKPILEVERPVFAPTPTPVSAPFTAVQPTPASNPIAASKPIVKKGHHPSPENWKRFHAEHKPDFSFVKPVVDVKGLEATQEEKKLVEQVALTKFKDAMKVMDYSIADTVSHNMGNKKNPELWETLDKFSSRYLDMYEAYLDVQKDDKEPFFNADIGFAKAYGMTHHDLKTFIEPAHWFMLQSKEIKKNILTSQLTEASLDNLGAGAKEKIEKIKNLYSRLSQFGVENNRIDELVEKLGLLFENPAALVGSKDPKFALLEELRSRTDKGEKEPGYVGSPLRLLNVLKGKGSTKIDPSATYRQKLYFIYRSKGMANEVASNPELLKKINQKLEKKGWQIDTGIADYLYKNSSTIPIFKIGVYAHENHVKGRVRVNLPLEKAMENAKKNPNRTFSQIEELSKDERTDKNDLNSPFRFKLSEAEELTLLGSTSEIENRQKEAKMAGQKGGVSGKADTSFFESPLDYQKRTTPLPWVAGKHYFELHDSNECKSPYLKAVEALGLPQQAGISGSTDQTLTMAGLVGVSSPEEIKRLRTIYLGWMTSHDDHSVDEILTSAKSFGVDYTPKPDYYKEIYAEDPSFVSDIAAEQEKRGFKMPDFYLSKEHAQTELDKIRSEREEKQANDVLEAMKDHKLFLKAIIGKPNTPEQNKTDLFGINSWSKFLKKLTNPTKKISKKGVKYVYNPLTEKLEPKQKSATPYYKGTKKTSVSLLPSNGKLLPYSYEQNDTVGLLFDRNESEFKDKYVFKADALTDNKWWRRIYTPSQVQSPDFPSLLERDVKVIHSTYGVGKEESFNHQRAGTFEKLVNYIEANKDFQQHNEILASLKKEGVRGIFCVNKAQQRDAYGTKGNSPEYDLFIRLKAVSNKISLKKNQGIDVPVFVIDQAKNQGLQLYSRAEQANDLEKLISNLNGEFDALVDLLAEKSQLDKKQVAGTLQKDLIEMQQYI